MSKGKKVGGIILVVIGTIAVIISAIFLLIGFALGKPFGAENGAMDIAMEKVEQQIEDARRTGVTTYGEITGIDSESMATIEFYCAEDNSWYYFHMMVVSDNYDVGSIVEVCYDPYKLDDPDYAPVVPELLMEGMDVILSTASKSGIVVGAVFGVIGLVLLIIGIVLLVGNKKDKKWVDEINARNAAMGIGGAPNNGYGQAPGGQPMNAYAQPQGGQPLSGYNQPQNAGQGQADGNTSNPYQQ